MTMQCDVYVQQNTQANSGIIKRKWVYSQTIPCRIEPIKSQGATNRADNKSFETSGRDEYTENLQVKLKTTVAMSKRWRISSIRSSNGQPVFFEIDQLNQPDTIFEVTASHPIMDPFGNTTHYEITLMRIPVQDNDTVRI